MTRQLETRVVAAPRRWWALGALASMLLVIGIDGTILNVALPTLGTELGTTTSQMQWLNTAYTLVLAAFLLPAGTLGDRYGQKWLLVSALGFFGIASVVCALSTSPEMLIAARAALGLGGAFLIPLSMSVLTVLFPAEERGRAIAVWAAAMAVGLPVGPIVGGWLLDRFWWGSIFFVNVPIVAISVLALVWLLPATAGSPRHRADVPGIALSSTGLLGVTYGLVEAGDQGWGSRGAVVPIVVGAALLVALVIWLRRATNPLFAPGLFASAGFTWGSIATALASFVMLGVVFVLPQYFQAFFATDALGTGVRLLPTVGGLVVGSVLADRLRPALGGKVVVAVGFAVMAVALAFGTTTDTASGYALAAGWTAAVGVGLGFALPTATDLAMGALSADESSVGSGVIQSLRQLGGTLGIAVLGSVLNAGYSSGVDTTGLDQLSADTVLDSPAAGLQVAISPGAPADLLESVRAAFVDGMAALLWTSAVVAVIAVIVALVFLPRLAQDQTESNRDHDRA